MSAMSLPMARQWVNQQWQDVVKAKMTRKERSAWESALTDGEERDSIWKAAIGRFRKNEMETKQQAILESLPRAARRALGRRGVDHQQFGFRVLSPTVRSRRQ